MLLEIFFTCNCLNLGNRINRIMKEKDIQRVVFNIRHELERYITAYNLKSLIIGESGGIDSAICTVLCEPVCKKLGVKLIGRSISIETNSIDEKSRGKAIGEAFCDDFVDVDLTDQYLNLRDFIEEDLVEDPNDRNYRVRVGNIKARLRMIYLYNLAQKHRGIVISTDNYTEYLQGFWTLHGDVGDVAPIQHLWKTEVYQLSQYIVDNELIDDKKKDALQRCIDCVPTDGLGITSSDLEQLGASTYSEVDTILKEYSKAPDNSIHENSKVVNRFKATIYKRNNPYNFPRDLLFKL